MRTTLTILTFCCLAFFAGAALAQTPDGETPAEEIVCDLESGAAFGLCNAYCEAMDCDCPTVANPTCEPSANTRACERVEANYIRLSGNAMVPCDAAVDCPCDDTPWPGGVGINPGSVWRGFSIGTIIPNQACTDAGGTLKIVFDVADNNQDRAATVVDDNTGRRCEEFSGDLTTPVNTRTLSSVAEVDACRALLLPRCP